MLLESLLYTFLRITKSSQHRKNNFPPSASLSSSFSECESRGHSLQQNQTCPIFISVTKKKKRLSEAMCFNEAKNKDKMLTKYATKIKQIFTNPRKTINFLNPNHV